MSAEPIRQENTKTGVWRISYDDGDTWQRTTAPGEEQPGGDVEAPSDNTGTDAWQGAKQGFTFGLGDEAQGAIATGLESMGVTDPIQRVTRGIEGVPAGETTYDIERDDERNRLAKARIDSPWATGVADAAASMSTLAIPLGPASGVMKSYRAAKGGKAVADAGIKGRAAQRAATGFGIGGAEGITRSDREDISGMIQDSMVSAGMGMISGPVLGGLVDWAAPRIAQGLNIKAEDLAAKAEELTAAAETEKLAAAGAIQSDLARIGKSPADRKHVVDTMERLELGKGKILPRAKDYQRDARKAKAEIQGRREQIMSEAVEGGAEVNQPRMASRIYEEVGGPPRLAGQGPQSRAWAKERGIVAEQGAIPLPGGGAIPRQGMPMDQATAFKRKFDDQSAFAKGNTDVAGQRQSREAGNIVNEEMASAIGERGPEWRQTGKDLQALITLEDLSNRGLSRLGNNKLGLTDYGSLTGGALVGAHSGGIPGALTGAAVGAGANMLYKPVQHELASKVARARASMTGGRAEQFKGRASDVLEGYERASKRVAGTPAAAGAATSSAVVEADKFATEYESNTDMVEGLAQTNPEALGKYGQQLAQASQMGPEHFTAKHQNLMETDPAYRQLMRELEGVEE